ncbi:MAG: hypothetical protein ACRDT0_13825 [Pseudonocardiaceae bacterium]
MIASPADLALEQVRQERPGDALVRVVAGSQRNPVVRDADAVDHRDQLCLGAVLGGAAAAVPLVGGAPVGGGVVLEFLAHCRGSSGSEQAGLLGAVPLGGVDQDREVGRAFADALVDLGGAGAVALGHALGLVKVRTRARISRRPLRSRPP